MYQFCFHEKKVYAMTLCLCVMVPTNYFWPRAPQSHNPALCLGAVLYILSTL